MVPRYPHILLPARLVAVEEEEREAAAAVHMEVDGEPDAAAAAAAGGGPFPTTTTTPTVLGIAYEHCAHDLGGLLEAGALGVCDALVLQRVAYQLLRGLSRAHERDVVLGAGFTPACVRVTHEGVVRLAAWETATVVHDKAAARATAGCAPPAGALGSAASSSPSSIGALEAARGALVRLLARHASLAARPLPPPPPPRAPRPPPPPPWPWAARAASRSRARQRSRPRSAR